MSALSRLIERGSVRKRGPDLAQLHQLIAPVSGVRLLDIGGGTGASTERFATGCAEVVVLEPDRRKVAEGRRLRPAIRFVEGHAEKIPFPDATFDRVTSVVAFHHMENQREALEEMRRVLKHSGQIVLFELPPSRAPGPLYRWIAGYRHAGHMTFHGPDELMEKLQTGGFTAVSNRAGITGYFVMATK
jgi:ubiquinone/menaquinone biosynthesis C-methylase UbiE